MRKARIILDLSFPCNWIKRLFVWLAVVGQISTLLSAKESMVLAQVFVCLQVSMVFGSSVCLSCCLVRCRGADQHTVVGKGTHGDGVVEGNRGGERPQLAAVVLQQDLSEQGKKSESE
jgi:hypothetical protein